MGSRDCMLQWSLELFLGNLQGGKVTEFILFGTSFNVSMGAILYSGIFFATDILNEKFGKAEASKAVMLGFVTNVAVMITLVVSTYFMPSSIAGSSGEVHSAIAIVDKLFLNQSFLPAVFSLR